MVHAPSFGSVFVYIHICIYHESKEVHENRAYRLSLDARPRALGCDVLIYCGHNEVMINESLFERLD